jgi:hypothetical protein
MDPVADTPRRGAPDRAPRPGTTPAGWWSSRPRPSAHSWSHRLPASHYARVPGILDTLERLRSGGQQRVRQSNGLEIFKFGGVAWSKYTVGTTPQSFADSIRL